MADTVWDQAAFDNAYTTFDYTAGVQVPAYRRDRFGQSWEWERRLIELGSQLPGFNPGANILIVGCGFGWTIERAIDLFGHTRIWGKAKLSRVHLDHQVQQSVPVHILLMSHQGPFPANGNLGRSKANGQWIDRRRIKGAR